MRPVGAQRPDPLKASFEQVTGERESCPFARPGGRCKRERARFRREGEASIGHSLHELEDGAAPRHAPGAESAENRADVVGPMLQWAVRISGSA